VDESAGSGRNLAAVAGGWSARHRRAAILGWLAFVAAASAVGMVMGQRQLSDVQMGNGESRQATRIFEQAFPYHTPEQVLVQATGSLRAGSSETVAAVRDLVRRLRAMPTVAQVRSPLGPGGQAFRSADGRSLLVTFHLAGSFDGAQRNVERPLAAVAAVGKAHPRVRLGEFGGASAQKAIKTAFMRDFQRAEYTSLPVTLVILLFAFGALVAAGLPLLLGFTAVLAAIGLLAPLSHLIPVNGGQIDATVALIGLAVGVDYSLFYLRRKLEERRALVDSDRALIRAAATSGQAVLISGLTVMTAMAGMFFAGNAIFSGLAMGTMTVVAVAVLGSVTVLPALMARLGDSVERGRVPILGRARTRGRSRAWSWLIDRVVGRPAVALLASAGILVALSVPALSLRTVDPGFVGMPSGLPVMQTYAAIERAFPGGRSRPPSSSRRRT
jgi:RND superfamily putative drug exporter